MTLIQFDRMRRIPGAVCAGSGAIPAATPPANDNFAPLGHDGAVTCDGGVALLLRIAGSR